MIILSKTHFSDIRCHAKEAYPLECCGAFLGMYVDGKKQVSEVIRLDNEWGNDDEKYRRFEISGQDYLSLEKRAKELNQTLLGFYHTHPDHEASPSETDLTYAWPFFSYIILSVKKGIPETMNSFELDIDNGVFVSERIECR